MKKILATIALLALPLAGAQAATVSTLADENSTIYPWGLPNTGTYGQTVTLSSAMSLDSVTFRINDGGNSIGYDLYVYAWDGVKAIGSALATISGSTTGQNAMANVTTTTGGIDLSAGDYVIAYQATTGGSASWGGVSGNADAAGTFVYLNNRSDTARHTLDRWSTFYIGDTAYSFEFSEVAPVPLPASLPFLVLGLGAIGVATRRKNVSA